MSCRNKSSFCSRFFLVAYSRSEPFAFAYLPLEEKSKVTLLDDENRELEVFKCVWTAKELIQGEDQERHED